MKPSIIQLGNTSKVQRTNHYEAAQAAARAAAKSLEDQRDGWKKGETWFQWERNENEWEAGTRKRTFDPSECKYFMRQKMTFQWEDDNTLDFYANRGVKGWLVGLPPKATTQVPGNKYRVYDQVEILEYRIDGIVYIPPTMVLGQIPCFWCNFVVTVGMVLDEMPLDGITTKILTESTIVTGKQIGRAHV